MRTGRAVFLFVGAFFLTGAIAAFATGTGSPTSAAVMALVCGVIAATLKTQPQEEQADVKHLRGVRFALDLREAQASIEPAIQRAGADAEIAPGVVLDSDSASQHQLIMGASGAGKSTVLFWLIHQIQKLGHRALINDVKGELMVLLRSLGIPADLIVAVGLARFARAWAVGIDIFTADASVLVERAQALADRLIEAPTNAGENTTFFANARTLVRTAIVICCTVYKSNWGFKELAEILGGSYSGWKKYLEEYYPAALSALGTGDRYTSSVLATLAQAADRCARLAAIFTDRRAFSFLGWMRGKAAAQFVVLVADSSMEDLSRWLAGAITAVVAQGMLDRDIRKEARATGHVITWLVLDEFASLGRLDQIQKIASLGRSLGVRLVLAVQSHAQLLQTYSEHAARAIMSCCSTAFLLQCAAGAAADQQFCAELVGRRQVLRRSTSASSTESESSSQPRKSKTSS
ncbi:MAG: type IV secretory system conjugative DNA transfer family protein, partial [Candidatus Binataceae bacterium]